MRARFIIPYEIMCSLPESILTLHMIGKLVAFCKTYSRRIFLKRGRKAQTGSCPLLPFSGGPSHLTFTKLGRWEISSILSKSSLPLNIYICYHNWASLQTMDTTMQNSTQTAPSHSRKRSVRDLEEDEDTIRNTYAAINLQEDKPLKRLQNRYGEAIKRQPKQYNVQKLLNNLAFTRFYVTSNFSNYDPKSSFVVLCMVSEQNELCVKSTGARLNRNNQPM